MGNHKRLTLFYFIVFIFVNIQSYGITYYSELVREEIIVAQNAQYKSDWLTIIKVAKAFVNQKENFLALQIIPWAQNIINENKTVNGANHLATFYKSLGMLNESDKWERLANEWDVNRKKNWQNK